MTDPKSTTGSTANYRGIEIKTLKSGEFQMIINGKPYTRGTLPAATALIDLKLKKYQQRRLDSKISGRRVVDESWRRR